MCELWVCGRRTRKVILLCTGVINNKYFIVATKILWFNVNPNHNIIVTSSRCSMCMDDSPSIRIFVQIQPSAIPTQSTEYLHNAYPSDCGQGVDHREQHLLFTHQIPVRLAKGSRNAIERGGARNIVHVLGYVSPSSIWTFRYDAHNEWCFLQWASINEQFPFGRHESNYMQLSLYINIATELEKNDTRATVW